MKNLLIIFFSIALSFCFICPIYAIEPEKDGNTYHFTTTYSRPSTSTNSGYIEILYAAKSTGDKFLRVYTWTIYENSEKTETDLESSFTPYMYINLESNGAITLAPRLSKSNNYGYVNVNCLKVVSNEWDVVVSAPVQSSGTEPHVTFGGTDSNYSILNYQVYGNYFMNSYDLFPNSSYYFTVNYGTQTYNYSHYFNQVISLLENSYFDLEDIKSFLNTLDYNQQSIILLLEEIRNHLLYSDDSVNDSTSVNDDFNDITDDIHEIEDSVVNDFTENIGNLPTFDFNGLTDFSTTAFWVSSQMQNIYDSSDKIRFIFTAALSFGVALMIIGRGTRL